MKTLNLAFLLALMVSGPLSAQSDWESVGPPGGHVIDFETDSSGSLYAELLGRVYRKTVLTGTWEPIPHLDTLARDGDGILPFIAIDHVLLAFSGCCQLSISRDSGKTWQYSDYPEEAMGNGLQPSAVWLNDTIYMVAVPRQSGILASTDTGTSWFRVHEEQRFDRVVTDGVALYLFSSWGDNLLRRIDGEISTLVSTEGNLHDIILHGDTLIVTGYTTLRDEYDRKISTDRGKSWRDYLLPHTGEAEILFDSRIWTTNDSALLSVIPGRESWDVVPSVDARLAGRYPVLAGLDRHLYIGGMDALYTLHLDSGSLTSIVQGLSGHRIVSLLSHGSGATAMGSSGAFRTDSTFAIWEWSGRLTDAYSWYGTFLNHNDTLYMHRAGTDTIFRSLNFGLKWQPHAVPTFGIHSGLHVADDLLIAGAKTHVALNRNRGNIFIYRQIPGTGGAPRVYSGSRDTIFATHFEGDASLVFRTYDGRRDFDSWEWINITPQFPRRVYEPLLQYSNGVLYHTYRNGNVSRSRDQGATWDDITPDEVEAGTDAPLSFSSMTVFGDSIVVTTTFSQNMPVMVLSSIDQGESWVRLPDVHSRVNHALFLGDALYLATETMGVLKLRLELGTNSERESSSGIQPCAPRLTGQDIVISTPVPGEYSARVYSVDGQLCRGVGTHYVPAGVTRFKNAAEGLPSGTYILSVTGPADYVCVSTVAVIR